jgi:PadR family transcriptional regulator, regulatory protein PadR
VPTRLVSVSQLRVLRALLDPGPHYGTELLHRTGASAGTIYPMLVRLHLLGWVDEEWEDIDEHAAGRRRRRFYSLTATGRHDAWWLLAETAAVLAPLGPGPQRPG